MATRKPAGKYKCEKCKKEISLLAKTRHDRSCDGIYKNYNKEVYKSTECCFCGEKYSTSSGCGTHVKQCKLNPNRVQRKTNYAWNKGKTKHTDIRILKVSEEKIAKFKSKEYTPSGFCSPEYYLTEEHRKNSSKGGGYRENAGRSKKFKVKDSFGKEVTLQSSYELKCSQLLNDMSIQWVRPSYLKYDVTRKYFPDFYLIEYDLYLDPKNSYLAKIDKDKIDKVIKFNNVKVYILTEEKITKEYLEMLLSPNGGVSADKLLLQSPKGEGLS
jgi:hypothetical protein